MKRHAIIALAAFSLLAACAARNEAPNCPARAYPEIGGPFTLIDHTGMTVTQADYADRTALVFFGFTFCPDVCPFTLYTLAQALLSVPSGDRPRILFVSVDPERDTPDVLAEYIANDGFPQPMTGLTGPESAIADVARAFAAGFTRIDDKDSPDAYMMEHSSIVYLMDRTWKLKTFFTHTDDPEQIAACIRQIGRS